MRRCASERTAAGCWRCSRAIGAVGGPGGLSEPGVIAHSARWMPSDEEQAAAAKNGDGDAFAQLYRRYVVVITTYMRRRSPSPEIAFDLTAETFAAAVAGIGSFRVRRGSFRCWLFGIAANELHGAWRRGQVEDRARRKLALELSCLMTRRWHASRISSTRMRCGRRWPRCQPSSGRRSRCGSSRSASAERLRTSLAALSRSFVSAFRVVRERSARSWRSPHEP